MAAAGKRTRGSLPRSRNGHATRNAGSVLPDNEVFGRKVDVEASPSTYKRAKQFLVTQGVLEVNDGPFYVA